MITKDEYLKAKETIAKYVEQLELQIVMQSNNSNKESSNEHGCPYQEEINGDYLFKCNCSEAEMRECAADI